LDGAAANAGFRLNYTITVNTYSALGASSCAAAWASPFSPARRLPNDAVLASRPIDPQEFNGTLAIMRLKGRPMVCSGRRLPGTHRAPTSPDLPQPLGHGPRRRSSRIGLPLFRTAVDP